MCRGKPLVLKQLDNGCIVPLRYLKRKEEAKEYWMKTHCTGTYLASKFGVSFSSSCRWIREGKKEPK